MKPSAAPSRFFLFALVSLFSSPLFADSLWTQIHPEIRQSLWADRRAINTGDIVTILIQETSESQAKEDFNRDRRSEAGANFSATLGPFGSHTGDLSFDSNRKVDTQREGNTTKSLTTRLAAVVKEKLFNGNLLVEATRELIVQDEVTTIVISGIIRPDDIRADNTILSENIAEAQIRYEGKGQIGDVRKRGRLGQRILDLVIPF